MSEHDPTTRGACLCGAVRFEVDRFVGPFELCHCARCRKAFGAAFAPMIGVERRDFRWLGGTEWIRTYEAPVRDHPPGFRSAFCSRCGSPVPDVPADARRFEVPAGLLDADFDAAPDRHIFVDSAAAWETIHDDVPRLTGRELVRLRLAGARAPDDGAVE